MISHVVQSKPLYPFLHSTGNISSGKYPPKHASSLNHLIIVVEFVFLRQYPLSTLICLPPKHSVWSMQFIHFVEFHFKEYEPAPHDSH